MSKIIGIDLGSTLSEVAIMEAGKPIVLVNEDGSRTTPSVISLKGEERKVGAAAKRQAVLNPKDTVLLIKRFMGGTYDEIKDSITHVQYDVKDVNGYPRVTIADKDYTPEELSAMIVGKMKKIAEDYLGEPVTEAVITVPAFFNDAQRQATKRAGEIAGLNVRRIIAEPTAAILASGIDLSKGGKYMVVDHGGATLDFSVADIEDSVVEIKASYGDVYCGGSDLDHIITDYLVAEFKKDNGIDLSLDSMAMSRVIEASEKAKIELSNSTSSEINLPYITARDGQPLHLVTSLSRAKFEQLIDKEITKVVNCGKEALKQANMASSELNGILLVGGSTRIPYVQDQLSKTFGVELIKTANPDEAVALGAAVQGSIIAGDNSEILLLDVTPLNLGIETMGHVMTVLIDANTTIPTKKSQIFSTAENNQPGVEINVLQGNRPMAKDNKQIGIFHLDGIAPAPKGVPQIEVTFDIDVNGILKVTAVDKATNKEQHITVENNGGLSEADIERMKKEAEENAEADKKAREDADKINQADAFAYQVEKALEEFGDKVTEEDKTAVTELITPLKEAVEKRDVEAIDKAQKELETKWYEVAGKVYQATNPQPDVDLSEMFSGATDEQAAEEAPQE